MKIVNVFYHFEYWNCQIITSSLNLSILFITISLNRMYPMNVFLFVLISGWFVSSSLGISCYVCKSEENPKCTESSSPGPPVNASNCANPNKLVNDWVTKHEFMKYGLRDVFNFFGDETSKAAQLKAVTACVYFFASSENVVTAELDKDVAQVRSFVGDKHAKDSVSISKWVMRDCVTIKIRQETEDSTMNKCFPLSGVKDLAKLHFCSCTTDKCNLPNAQVRKIIDEEDPKSGHQSSIILRDSILKAVLPIVLTVSLR